MRTILRGGTVWDESGAADADVVIDAAGRIEALVPRGGQDGGAAREGGAPAQVIDVSGLWVLPGAVDAHVHFRDPGLTAKEDFLTGSAAAAVGGVTTVLDMPNTLPPVNTAAAFAAKLQAVAGRAYTDFGLFGAATAWESIDDLIAHVDGLIEQGAVGIKVLLGPTTGNLSAPSWGELYQLLALHAERTVFVFHCEDRSVIEVATPRVPRALAAEYRGLLAARPRFGEILATAGVLELAGATGARVHVAHVALAEAVGLIARAKGQGWPVTAETCPQYLFLCQDDYEAIGPVMKVLPPIRSARDRDELVQGLRSGAIDLVATDHAPHEPPTKSEQPVWEGSFGMAGVQLLLPLLVDLALRGGCSIPDVVRWTSAAPARAFGLYPAKGALRPGSDADLVVIDPHRAWCVADDWWKSKSRNTAFWGRSGRGFPAMTFLRGRLVQVDGRVCGPPRGRLVRPRAGAGKTDGEAK